MTIFYVCNVNDQTPYGGVLVMYRHVDLLNDLGIDARLVHGRTGFRCEWFENETELVYPPFDLNEDDVLVLPEWLNRDLGTVAPGIPKVSLNQNAYFTFRRQAWHEQHPYVGNRDLLGVITVSEQNTDYLAHTFPELEVQRVQYSYGPQFMHALPEHKPRRIAYMPRKRGDEATQVLGMLQARGALEGWEVLALDGMTQREVAANLQHSAIFLSFGKHEGFGMPPVEAMACGAAVIGYSGFGGDEFFEPRFAQLVSDGDVLKFARLVELALRDFDPLVAMENGLAASEWVREKYSHENERQSLASAYEALLARRQRSTSKMIRFTREDTWLHDEAPRTKWRRSARLAKQAIHELGR